MWAAKREGGYHVLYFDYSLQQKNKNDLSLQAKFRM